MLIRMMRLLLALLLLSPVARSAEKAGGVVPILRVETGHHSSAIHHLSADAAGRWLLTVAEDRTARSWDLATGKAERVFRVHQGPGADGSLYAGVLSPDGRTVVLAALAGTSTLFVIDRAS